MPAAAAILCIGLTILSSFPAKRAGAQSRQKLSSLPNDPSAVKLPPLKDHFLIDRLPLKPTARPVATIPVDPLDFSAPSPAYFGYRYSWVSLDFLDEDHLLFTFRVPGLIVRTPGSKEDDEERRIRAVVLSLPSGAVQAETLWTLHDRERYLWVLRDGHFLLRNRDTLYEGDASLGLQPMLHFPGPLLWLGLDPTQQLLVADSHEPVAETAKSGENSGSATAAAGIGQGGDSSQSQSQNQSQSQADFVLRVLRRGSGQVVLVSRLRGEVHLPIDANGYLDSVRGTGSQWTVNLNYFTGGTSQLGLVNSECSPTLDFVSARELLATTCKKDGGYRFTAFSTGSLPLWQDTTSGYTVWPILTMSLNGLRIVRETLAVTRLMGSYWALDRSAVKAQRVRVFDAADGAMVFEATVDPAFDDGGNVAISP
ncbi:MAG: hypothetical protein ACRD27_09215, partial [Terracidiphilus sp.]